MIFLQVQPTPDDIDQKKQESRQEINKVLKYVQSVSKEGSKFIFGDKVKMFILSLYEIYICTDANIFVEMAHFRYIEVRHEEHT